MILKNFSSGILASGIGTSDTTITVNADNTLPSVAGTFTAIIWDNTTYTDPSQDPNAEIVLGVYVSPNTYTITRAQENTSAVAHSIGAVVGLYITAGVLGTNLPPGYGCSYYDNEGGGFGQNITSAAYRIIHYNTKNFDIASEFNTSTYLYTATVSGYYQVNAQVGYINTIAGANYFLQILINGSLGITNEIVPGQVGSGNFSQSVSNIFYLTAGSTIGIYATSSSASNSVVWTGIDVTWLSIMRIR